MKYCRFVILGSWMLATLACISFTYGGTLIVSGPGLTDFDQHVDPAGIYTHAVNVGPGDVTVNDVVFDEYTTAGGDFGPLPGPASDDQSGNSFELSGTDNFVFFGSGGSALVGTSAGFADGLTAIGSGGDTLTVDLAGLVSGQSYEFSLYYLNWDGTARTANLFDGGVDEGSFTVDPGPGPGSADNRTGTIVRYRYVATGTTASFDIVGAVSNSHPHLHAFSNQAVPEPSSFLIGVLEIVGLVATTRRTLV